MTLKDIETINAEYVRLKKEGGYDAYNLPNAEGVLQYLVAAINSAPTIEAEPVRHARLSATNGWFYCGFCNSILIRKDFCCDALQPPRYCMWCGSKLIDEVNE